MKKLTFMLIAALIAVTSWAQPTAVKSRQLLPEQFAVKTATTLKQAPQMKKEMAPRQALKAKMQAPAKKANMKKAKAAPKKALDFTALLSGEPATLMVKSYVWTAENVGTEEEPDYQTVLANIARVTEDWTITLDLATMTASIVGIGGGETAVTGTVDAETMAITIPYGQATGTSSYGTLGLASATGEESLVCTLTEDAIVFGDYWYIALIDGDYAGYQWSDIYESVAVQPNGTMAWGDTEVAVDIDFDEDYFIATVWNFGGEGVGIDVTLKPEGKFVIESQLIYEGGETYGDFYTYNSDCNTPTISGTGTENTLTFGSTWTCYAPSTGYWYNVQQPATITFDGTFVYPEIPDNPATPADPEVTFFDFWNGTSATVTLTVPCVDVDGNDIKGSLLTYQLFTMDDSGAPVALGEPIAYDSEANGTGDTKTVVLGEEAKNLVVIGAKSIYTAGGETNESNIAWFGIPQLVELPEGVEVKEYPVTADGYYGSSGWQTYTGTALVGVVGTDVYVQGILPHCPEGWAKGTLEDGVVTFPVQCVGIYGGVYIYLASYGDSPMDVDTSTNVTKDGDITETLELTEGSVTLAISPKDEEASTPNRFWATNAGPQLRVYSGTLTFSVPLGYGISKIAFNHNGKWGANTVNGEAIANDTNTKVATWTIAEGEEPVSEVVVAIAANTQLNSIVVSVEAVPMRPVVVPSDLATESYLFEGFDTYHKETVTSTVQVGFNGEKEVYIQGLSTGYLPEAWVKGTLNGTTLTIPETYLGIWTYGDTDYEIIFSGATFVYDAEAGKFASEEGYTTITGQYTMDEFSDVVLTFVPDVAATPADPVITEIKTVNNRYPSISFNIPTEDVNGNPLLTEKLTYQLWIEKNGEATPLVLEADLYDYLDDDMSEIPYGYTDSWDIYETKVYLNQDLDEIYSWDKIGIQSIYYGGGEVNKSNIAWTYNIVPVTVGEALYATYVAPADVDFTTVEGVEAFAATISPKKTYVQLTPVTTVPAGTAVVVKAEKAATFAITKTEGAVLGAENDLVAAVDDVTADGTQYILAKKEEGVGFYKAGGTIAAGKGYLAVGGAGVKGFYGFDDDDATGIDGIGNGQLTIGNEIYNVAGQRVSKMQKGVNIVNGKKILK